MARVFIGFDNSELNALQYGVVVEMWDKRRCGKGRRRWLEEFSEYERKKAAEWYTTFYRWAMVNGTPLEHVMMPSTYAWLNNKLIPFFASL